MVAGVGWDQQIAEQGRPLVLTGQTPALVGDWIVVHGIAVIVSEALFNKCWLCPQLRALWHFRCSSRNTSQGPHLRGVYD